MICYKCQKEIITSNKSIYVKVKDGLVTTTFCQPCYIMRQ